METNTGRLGSDLSRITGIDINLLKDVLGDNYQVVSDALKGSKLAIIAFDYAEPELVQLLGQDVTTELQQVVETGVIPSQFKAQVGYILMNDVAKALGASPDTISVIDSIYEDITGLQTAATTVTQAG